ncbi:MAG: HAMP domain-containing sensor histidine kinase [Planctomycetota bacterium]|nr:HAMP domain-containing sensor histidine kinase [Planctomycetota bacterium]
MKRPLHVWAIFGGFLLVAFAGMGWLTMKATELERDQEALFLQADFEGDVRLALRRMDRYLVELFAEESAWPHFAYEPFYVPQIAIEDGDGKQPDGDLKLPVPIASPLLKPNSNRVCLYVQRDRKVQAWCSPNLPADEQRDLAVRNGLDEKQLSRNGELLNRWQSLAAAEDIWSQLPEAEELAAQPAAGLAWNEAAGVSADGGNEGPAQAVNPAPAEQQGGRSVRSQAQQELDLAQADVQKQTLGKTIKKRTAPQTQQSRSKADYIQRKIQNDEFASNLNSRLQQRSYLLNNDTNYSVGGQLVTQLMLGASSPKVIEGRSRPIWIGSELVLARRVKGGGKASVQAVWLNWEAIQEELADLVKDLVPDLTIVPVDAEADAEMARMLAALPAQLIVAAPRPEGNQWTELSPLQLSLFAAWGCLILAGIAAALLLAGVISLSERRAAFVSAVTHELRTPLTTFRMYSEMLAENMVPDKSRRQSYLNTLRSEADRLFHLVENVLSYARLERGRKRTVQVANTTVGGLLSGMQRRLEERAGQSEMELVTEADDDVLERSLVTDVSAIEQIAVNLVDNACKYAAEAADRRIHLQWAAGDGEVVMRVRDHGPGVDQDVQRRLFEPFTKSAREAAHSAPGVGLGLALCRRLARQLGGRLSLESSGNGGACFALRLPGRTA